MVPAVSLCGASFRRYGYTLRPGLTGVAGLLPQHTDLPGPAREGAHRAAFPAADDSAALLAGRADQVVVALRVVPETPDGAVRVQPGTLSEPIGDVD